MELDADTGDLIYVYDFFKACGLAEFGGVQPRNR